jgi:hypothetical protein
MGPYFYGRRSMDQKKSAILLRNSHWSIAQNFKKICATLLREKYGHKKSAILLRHSHWSIAQNFKKICATLLREKYGHKKKRHTLKIYAPHIYEILTYALLQWWASYFHKVTELLFFRYCWKKLATFNPLPILPSNGSVTVTSYLYFKCNEKLWNGTVTPLHLSFKIKKI